MNIHFASLFFSELICALCDILTQIGQQHKVHMAFEWGVVKIYITCQT
jgi:hypothetical protein